MAQSRRIVYGSNASSLDINIANAASSGVGLLHGFGTFVSESASVITLGHTSALEEFEYAGVRIRNSIGKPLTNDITTTTSYGAWIAQTGLCVVEDAEVSVTELTLADDLLDVRDYVHVYGRFTGSSTTDAVATYHYKRGGTFATETASTLSDNPVDRLPQLNLADGIKYLLALLSGSTPEGATAAQIKLALEGASAASSTNLTPLGIIVFGSGVPWWESVFTLLPPW